MKKRLLTLAFSVAMLVAVLLTIASCGGGGNKHEHDYAQEKIPATCTEAGRIIYTCECGESYTDKGDAALGHKIEKHDAKPATCTEEGYASYESCARCNYNTKVVIPVTGHYYLIEDFTLPTLNAKGEKTVVCDVCGAKNTEEIDSISVAIPAISDMVAAIIEELSFALETTEGSEIVITTVSSDYSKGNGSKDFVRINPCEAKLFVENGTPKGYLKIDVEGADAVLDGTVAPENVTAGEFTHFAEIEIYLVGDVISVGGTVDGDIVNENNEKYSVTDFIFDNILAGSGITEEGLSAIIYFGSEIIKCLPEYEEIANAMQNIKLPEISDTFLENLSNTFALFGEEFLTVTQNPDGTITYVTDFTAINVFIDALKDKNVAEAIDSIYGKGSADAIKDFVMSLPELTVKEIAEFAITAAENFGFEIDQIFELVDVMIYQFTGEAICVKYELEKEYNTTIIELVNGDAEGFDKEEAIANYKKDAGEFFDKFYAYNLEDALREIIGEGYQDADLDALIDRILEIADQLNGVLNIEVVTDAEGKLESIEFVCNEATIVLTVDGDEVRIVLSSADVSATLIVDNDSFYFNVSDANDNSVLDAYLTTTGTQGNEKVIAGVEAQGIEVLTYSAEYNNGDLVMVDLTIKSLGSTNDEQTGETTYYEAGEIVSLSYTRTNESETIYSAILNVAADGKTVVVANLYVNGDDNTIVVEGYDVDGNVVAGITANKTVVGENTTVSLEFYAKENGFNAVEISAELLNGAFTSFDIIINSITRDEVWEYDEEIGESYLVSAGDYYISNSTEISYEKVGDAVSVNVTTSDGIEFTFDSEVTDTGFRYDIFGTEDGKTLLDASLIGSDEADGYHVSLEVEANEISNRYEESAYGEYKLTDSIYINIGFVVN